MKLAIVLGLCGLMLACSNLTTRRQHNQNRPGSGAVVVDKGQEQQESQQQAEQRSRKLTKLGVVLGPGGVKTFAQAGFIKALSKEKIPVESIIGIEWGSLVAALYAQKGQSHDVEWKLYKLKEKDLVEKGFLSGKRSKKKADALRPFLKQNLKGSVNSARVNYACPSLSLWSGTTSWKSSGSFQAAIESCLPYPPLFEPKSPRMASSFAIEQAIRRLKKRGVDVVVVVNVLGRKPVLSNKETLANPSAAILFHELQRQYSNLNRQNLEGVEIFNLPTDRFKLYDFSDRTKLVAIGERAGSQAARRLIQKYDF